MAILRPLLAETGAEPIGKVVIGTVKGDIHDIGKNLVAMMLEGAGFEVFDLGVNTDVDEFLAALDEHQPDILGHVGAAHHDDAVHEGRHRHARSRRASATTTSCSSAARRSTRSSAPPSAPTPTAATRRSPPRPRRAWSPPRAGADVRRRARSGPACLARDRRRSCSRAARWPRELRAVLAAELELGDARATSTLPARPTCTTGPTRIVPDAAAARWQPPATRAGRSSSPTPTAAPAARSTAGSPTGPAPRRLPGAHCYEVFAGAAAFAALARRRARHLLPHRLPRQALRRARVAGARSRPSSRAARPRTSRTTGASCCSRSRDDPRRASRRGRGRRPSRLGLALRAPSDRAAPRTAGAPVAGVVADRRRPRRAAAPVPELVVICWRDIPAQVNAQRGRGRGTRCCCPRRFQRAIDEAGDGRGHRHGATSTSAQWRRDEPLAVRPTPTRRRPRPTPRRDAPRRRVPHGAAAARSPSPAAGTAAPRAECRDATRTPPASCSRPAGRQRRRRRRAPRCSTRRGASASTSTRCAAGAAICGRCQVSAPDRHVRQVGASTSDAARPERAGRGRARLPRPPAARRRRSGSAAPPRIVGDVVIDVPAASQVHRPVVRKDARPRRPRGRPARDARTTSSSPRPASAPTRSVADAAAAARCAEQHGVDGRRRATRRCSPRLHRRSRRPAARDGRPCAVRRRAATVVAVWPGLRRHRVRRRDRRRLDHHRRSPLRPRHRRGARVGREDEPADPLRRGPDEPGVVRDDEPGRRRRAHRRRARRARRARSASCCDAAGVDRATHVLDVVIVGNPIMHHLVLGIDPTPLGTAPFALATDEPSTRRPTSSSSTCPTRACTSVPCIAGHVGADTAAAMLAARVRTAATRVQLLVDVGTNAEIVLGDRDGVVRRVEPDRSRVRGRADQLRAAGDGRCDRAGAHRPRHARAAAAR